jgi:hypothetical protein
MLSELIMGDMIDGFADDFILALTLFIPASILCLYAESL